MMERPNCVVCDNQLSFTWTDTHGVGSCTNCGMPYTIYHYENDVRVDRPPQSAITEEGIAIARRYWAETKRRCFPGAYDMGISGRRGATYSGATEADFRAWDEWCEAMRLDDSADIAGVMAEPEPAVMPSSGAVSHENATAK